MFLNIRDLNSDRTTILYKKNIAKLFQYLPERENILKTIDFSGYFYTQLHKN